MICFDFNLLVHLDLYYCFKILVQLWIFNPIWLVFIFLFLDFFWGCTLHVNSTLLLGQKNYENLISLIYMVMTMYPLLVMLPGGISFSISVKSWMYVMESYSSRTGDTIPNYLYYVYHPSYQPPMFPQGCCPPGTLVRALMSSTDTNPAKISWTNTIPDQTSPIDVGLGPNIINRT